MKNTAPKHLPIEQRKKWDGLYSAALNTARMSHPDDEKTQHTVALKEANKMLAVAPPKSAAEIDKLEDWQVQSRVTKEIDDVPHRRR